MTILSCITKSRRRGRAASSCFQVTVAVAPLCRQNWLLRQILEASIASMLPKLRTLPFSAVFAACVAALLAGPSALAVTPAEADAAFAALNHVYWDPAAKYYHKEESGDTKADFWLEAQLWDTVMDQYERTHSRKVRQQIDAVYDGFLAVYPDWTQNKYNDDIMWWVIGCTRAYQFTGEKRYLRQAKANFDFVYTNFCDTNLGGGIWWTSDRRSKNSCIEGPAVIAALRLSALLKDPAYFEKGKSIYEWQRKTLTDGKGKVFDSIRLTVQRSIDSATNVTAPATNRPGGFRRRNRGPLSTFSLTYNQGTYIGASVLLYLRTKDPTYLSEAKKAADWTRNNLCTETNQILRSEGQGNGGAFKGIFVRYMKLLVREGGAKEYLPWMRANADTAWRNRRPADQIMGYDWSAPTGKGIQSQSASSAVALVVCFPEK